MRDVRQRLRYWLPADAGWALGAIALLLLSAICSTIVRPAPLLAAAGALSASAMLVLHLARQRRQERDAARICGRTDISSPLRVTLPLIAARLREFEHRGVHMHPITGLPTREHLFSAIERDIAGDGDAMLLGVISFVDFTRFSAFDPDGAHAALATLAERLRSAARHEHVIAHVDRDCFAIWFRESSQTRAGAEFRAIVHAVDQEIDLVATVLRPTIKIGAAHLSAGDDPALLLTRAIVALEEPGAAAAGSLPTQRSAEAVREQFTLEQDLARAIEGGQLKMLFQPVADLALGRIVGAEALLRWDHPVLGPIPPARFIPVVEAVGLGDRYGAWVLNAAVREAKRWRTRGLEGLRVAVNLSARQLLDPGLANTIARTLERHGVDAGALELELTETAAMADASRTLSLFGELRATGISLAIDDFGSGYSSLSYLKNLPFDKLKIDREFVQNVHERRDSLAICKALLELGRGLDLRVLAEGVETADEVAALAALGCTLFQGFFFARPMAADDFIAAARDPGWMARRASAPHRRLNDLQERLIA